MKTTLCVLLLVFGANLNAQVDTTVLTLEKLYSIIKQSHPIALQASIIQSKAQSGLTQARGAFDPKLKFNNEEKFYKNTTYFNLINSSLAIPTWYGIELKSGYDLNRGTYLDPADNTPSEGLLYAGLSVSLGQGLFIDERRATLKQANIMLQQSKFEQFAVLNELFYNAGKAYWDWFSAYHQYEVFKQAEVVALERFNGVKTSAVFGDRPSIDTLEASIQYQERVISRLSAELELKNKALYLSLFLWGKDQTPLELTDKIVPPAFSPIIDVIKLELNPDSSSYKNHPELLTYKMKREQLLIEKKWKKEQLKPIVNLSYQPITSGNLSQSFSSNDYKFGFNVSMPLFLRKEVGALKLTKFKIQETELDIQYKQQEIYNKTLMALNEYETTSTQVSFYAQTVDAYSKLLEAEKSVFNSGESSLFLLNARELSYIASQVKLIELVLKNRKSYLNTEYSSGNLFK